MFQCRSFLEKLNDYVVIPAPYLSIEDKSQSAKNITCQPELHWLQLIVWRLYLWATVQPWVTHQWVHRPHRTSSPFSSLVVTGRHFQIHFHVSKLLYFLFQCHRNLFPGVNKKTVFIHTMSRCRKGHYLNQSSPSLLTEMLVSCNLSNVCQLYSIFCMLLLRTNALAITTGPLYELTELWVESDFKTYIWTSDVRLGINFFPGFMW